MRRQRLIPIFICFTVQTTFGQQLHKDIKEIYNFEPHKLSKEEQIIKAKLMDGFWGKVIKDKDRYLGELRSELKDTTNSLFFLYDGGHLLISLSSSKHDYQIALDAMKKGNLADIDHTDYVKTINFFARNDLNTTDAALKIIPIDTFAAYIPQHAMFIDKGLALRFMLLPINSNLYLKKTIEKLSAVKDTTTIKHVLNFLFYTCTCEGDSTISKYAADKNQDKAINKYSTHLVEMNNVRRHDNSSKYQSLIKKRKEILNRISDEALDELDDLSRILKQQYNCPKL